MCNITDKLFKIVDQIEEHPDIPSLLDVVGGKSNSRNYYGTLRDKLTPVAESVLDIEKASIALVRIPKTGRFPLHEHKTPVLYELLIILDGELKLTVEGVEKTLREFEVEKINRNVKHSAYAEEDVLLIAISIPRDEGFPRQST